MRIGRVKILRGIKTKMSCKKPFLFVPVFKDMVARKQQITFFNIFLNLN